MTWKERDQADRQRYERQRRVAGEPAAVKDSPTQGEPETLYSQLGVAPSATAAELRKAWLQLLVTAHPDKGGCPDRFHSLQQAYALLSDPAQRVIYDEKLAKTASSLAPAAAAAAVAHASGRVVHSGKGVTIVVHGQTGPIKPPAAAAGGSGRGRAGLGAEIAELTGRIDALQLEHQASNASGAAAAAAAQSLAEVYVQRAWVHQLQGRLHHAYFDTQEAARLCPGWDSGAQLLMELDAMLQQAEAAPATGSQARPESSDDDDNGAGSA